MTNTIHPTCGHCGDRHTPGICVKAAIVATAVRMAGIGARPSTIRNGFKAIWRASSARAHGAIVA